MQPKSHDWRTLISPSKKFINENENLVDIIVIGSSVRGEFKPGDVDAVLVTRHPDPNLSQKFTQYLSTSKIDLNVHPVEFPVDKLFSSTEPLVLNILHEGHSIKAGLQFGDVIHFKPYTLFTYSISKFDKNTKQKFFYALKGRGTEGILKKVRGMSVAPSVALIPIESEDEFDEFLTGWKVDFEKRRIFYEL